MNKLYHTFYSTNCFVVSVTRNNEVVDICIYDKTGVIFKELACATFENVSDKVALKLTRESFGL